MADVAALRDHYARLDDTELVKLSHTELVPEARDVLLAELAARGITKGKQSAPPPQGINSQQAAEPRVEKKTPPWSRALQAYGSLSPLLILPLFGVKGVLWIGIACLAGCFAALQVAIRTRSMPATKGILATVGNFIVVHLITLGAYIWVLRTAF